MFGDAPAHQVEIVNAEAYAYDGECIAKAEELGKPGLVDIQPKQVHAPHESTEQLSASLHVDTHCEQHGAVWCEHSLRPHVTTVWTAACWNYTV